MLLIANSLMNPYMPLFDIIISNTTSSCNLEIDRVDLSKWSQIVYCKHSPADIDQTKFRLLVRRISLQASFGLDLSGRYIVFSWCHRGPDLLLLVVLHQTTPWWSFSSSSLSPLSGYDDLMIICHSVYIPHCQIYMLCLLCYCDFSPRQISS